jgi:DNA (cytosine-5)-methyltransferase 1
MSNDNCPKKGRAYVDNFGGHRHICADVETLTTDDLPGRAALAWGSFPCQDLSLAGPRGGFSGKRSSTFWPFWRLMEQLAAEGRRVPLLTLENVVGAITSNGGRDFEQLTAALASAGYLVGAFVIDAVRFLPQSRPRLFVVAFARDLDPPAGLWTETPGPLWHPPALQAARARFPAELAEHWRWWRLPEPPPRTQRLRDIVLPDSELEGVDWRTPPETRRLLGLMNERNHAKVEAAARRGRLAVGTVYRRTRPDGQGRRVQRAEVRFDGVAGCLRTPGGGSSRQTLLFVEGDAVRSRLLAPREAARLMGVPDSYRLPHNYNEAYHLLGDGLAVPAVHWLAAGLLRPLAEAAQKAQAAA